MTADGLGAITWQPTPDDLERARLTGFMRWLGEHRGVHLDDYRAVWRWSVDDLEGFWSSVAAYFDLLGDGWGEGPALADDRMPGAEWFPAVHLNFAENVLRPALDPARRDEIAIVDLGEDFSERTYTWGELADRVGAIANWLRDAGVGPGDRVAAVLPNLPEAVIGLLAAASVGAIWSINSPELSPEATLSRLEQLSPRVLFATEGYQYGGKTFDVSDRLARIEAALPSLEATVVIGADARPGPGANGRDRVPFDTIVADAARDQTREPTYTRVAFAHPLWVLFSSGTTGAPKGIVHGHGGMLLEAVKGCGLNLDMGPGDRYYVAANTSWMVWNTLVNNLATGASVVTYAGSPTAGSPDRQLRNLERTRATMFATGAAYLQLVEQSGVAEHETYDLGALRAILSTGSPLPVSTWLWVHRTVKEHVRLGSDTGGTDICSGFIGSNALEPVRAGYLQGPLLGVAVEAWNEAGERVIDEVGDLIVRRPMPSMPLYLWGDDSGERYRSTYFSQFPGAWTQGDWITESPNGGFVVHGRSDATLNRQGVRVGPTDIYAALRDLPEVRDGLVIGVELPDGDYWMPLFVTLADDVALDAALTQRIAREIRSRASARHVPDEIFAVPAIPVTHAQKKLEVPIKRLFAGYELERAVNLGAVANPESIDWFAQRAAEFRADRGLSVTR